MRPHTVILLKFHFTFFEFIYLQPFEIDTVTLAIMQFNIRSLKRGQSENEYKATVEFNTFVDTFAALNFVSNNNNILIDCSWYEHYGKFIDERILGGIAEINVDCVHEILKRLNFMSLANLVQTDESFLELSREHVKTMNLSEETCGKLGVMNFRYIMETFGRFVVNLTINKNVFRYIPRADRRSLYAGIAILYSINSQTGPLLSNIHLKSFKFSRFEQKFLEPLVNEMKQKSINITFD